MLDSKGSGDRYTVVFTKAMSSVTGSYAETWVSYLGMSGAPTHPQGVSVWGEMEAYKDGAVSGARSQAARALAGSAGTHP